MLTVFGDESYDGQKQHVFAVSGIAATQEEWDALETIWLDRTGGKIFHAADCEADRGDFKDIPHENNLKLYKDLVQILVNTNIWGLGVVVDLKEFKELFPNAEENTPYLACFVEVIEHFAKKVYFQNPQQKVKFMFEQNSEVRANSNDLYEYLSSTSDWKYTECLIDEISWAGKSIIGIQAADIIAHEAMKDYYNEVSSVKRHTRKSMEALFDTGRYRFIALGRKFLSVWKDSKLMEQGAGFTIDDREQWLRENKLKNNLGNSIKFLLHKPDRTKEKS